MTDPRTYRIEREIREIGAFLTDNERENAEAHQRMWALIEAERMNLRRDDALRLEILAERLTGVKR
jgi:hypothetical protein